MELSDESLYRAEALIWALERGRLSSSTRSGQQYVIGRETANKLICISMNFGFLNVDLFEVIQRDKIHMTHGQQYASASSSAPIPIGE
jgi:hypothetical protein